MINEEKAVTNKAIIDLKRYLLAPLLVATSVLMVLIFGVKLIVIVFVLCFSVSHLVSYCKSIWYLIQNTFTWIIKSLDMKMLKD